MLQVSTLSSVAGLEKAINNISISEFSDIGLTFSIAPTYTCFHSHSSSPRIRGMYAVACMSRFPCIGFLLR